MFVFGFLFTSEKHVTQKMLLIKVHSISVEKLNNKCLDIKVEVEH